jgi:hypothetical protein
VPTEARDDRWEQALNWVAVIAVTVFMSTLAFVLTGVRCRGMGVGLVLGRSAYCSTTNAPGLASTPIGIAFEFMLFCLPSLVAVTAALRWAVTGRRPSVTLVSLYCTASVVLSLLLVAAAQVQYAPMD